MVCLPIWLLGLVAGSTQGNYAEAARRSEPSVIQAAFQSQVVAPRVFHGDLRAVPRAQGWQPGTPVREVVRIGRPRSKSPLLQPTAAPSVRPSTELQPALLPGAEPQVFETPTRNFEGISFTGVVPPDTVGDVGPNHYVQMVNVQFAIFDKMGTILAGPLDINTLWSGFGGVCEMENQGDPIVLYDHLADRWLLSQFAFSRDDIGTPTPPFFECIAISQGPDPVSSGFFLYAFETPVFPDYPKFGVWPDAYYMATNESSDDEPTPAVYAFDRTQMLQGQPATFQRFTAPPLGGFGFQALIPSDLDGPTPPPAGSPNYFMRHRDDEAHDFGANDTTQDVLELWAFQVDFANAANSSFTGPIEISITEFDSDLCGLFAFACFPQPAINPFDLDNTQVNFVPANGTYTVRSAAPAFEAELGTNLGLDDDDSSVQVFGFTFPFQGNTYTSVFVNANGNLTFGASDGNFMESVPEFVNGPPRIALLWHDLFPAAGDGVFFKILTNPNRAVITWSNVPDFNTASLNTAQVVLHETGEINFVYQGIGVADAIVGIGPGGGAGDENPLDFSEDLPTAGLQGHIFEQFSQAALDPLREVIMWRLQYRNFDTHETFLGNFVTDVDGTDRGGIRWFELRRTPPDPQGVFTLFQEGTHSPDSDHRWMGSIAMDQSGNIALGYSVSSKTTFPSIRYAGRRADDPLGTLPVEEVTIIDGGGSQTFADRWGDYSSMNVDPTDDCTFWYTNEYIPDDTGFWSTRVAAFSFSTCGKTSRHR
jgi:hypothetical protein